MAVSSIPLVRTEPAARTGQDDKMLKDAANQFESVFVSLMLSEALTQEGGKGLFGEGPGSTVMQGLLEQTLADRIAQAGGLGIGERLYQGLRQAATDERKEER